MSELIIMSIVKKSLLTAVMIAAPVLIASLVIGLIISIFQATTQIQEQTLTFVPKLIGILLIIAVLGGWMLRTLSTFTVEIFDMIKLITK
ncbi:flagellar biosynthesis protein FliQ [Clostridioides mangenotii]|uniref:flagellar biosynthesis protein FliQ n=1 Tax=Metaclostridioides mangenotii TaxID=1540 RepID=UPI001C102EB6|nr:flagellar biosynthesis protein FliQ [Clostridioides mangenotii]MBU5307831.1 flagellar biosynthesis protein FliQ [Clostridioides mangenotii]MCR1953954.1 flagellar biosynthesis protein FliQ [Clostridioides mangenotii]